MIMMGGYCAAVAHHPRDDLRLDRCRSSTAARLRDGSRRITHITEVMGMEGDVIITQDLFLYEILGEDANGNLMGQHKSTGIGRPKFWDRARYYGEDQRLAAALDAADADASARVGARLASWRLTGFSFWWRSRSAASPGSSSIRSCPASGTPNGAWRASRGGADGDRRPTRVAQKSRREQVEGTLKEIEERQKKARSACRCRCGSRKPGSTGRSAASWSPRARSAWSRFLVALLWSARGLLPALGFGFAAGFGLPLWLLDVSQETARSEIPQRFPDAVDVIVRGIKAGLPLLDSLKLIANEADEPIRSEFRAHHRDPDDRHSARRSLPQALRAHAGRRKRISSASSFPSSSAPAAISPRRSATCRACCATARR